MSTVPNEIRTEPRPDCFLCGLPGLPLYQNLPSALFETPGRWNFSRCPRPECGLIWINPTPVAADLHRAYATYFTHSQEEGGASGSKLRDGLYTLYHYANYPGWWLAGIQRQKRQWEHMYLDRYPAGKLLDVGCGDGRFLNRMREAGWVVEGIDFDADAVARAKERYGLNLRVGELREAALPAGAYDAVTMSHVIEHVLQPVELLAEIHRLLKPGGHLVITTPNTESLGFKKFGACWFGLDAPRHLNLFSGPSLSAVARRAGFARVAASSASVNADIFIGASYTIQENRNHRMGHFPAPNPWRAVKAAYWQYHEHFARLRHPACGEELVLLCTKD